MCFGTGTNPFCGLNGKPNVDIIFPFESNLSTPGFVYRWQFRLGEVERKRFSADHVERALDGFVALFVVDADPQLYASEVHRTGPRLVAVLLSRGSSVALVDGSEGTILSRLPVLRLA